MTSTKMHSLNKGQFLYKHGDPNDSGFFFILNGKIKIMVAKTKNGGPYANSEMEFSEFVEINEYFGFRANKLNDVRCSQNLESVLIK